MPQHLKFVAVAAAAVVVVVVAVVVAAAAVERVLELVFEGRSKHRPRSCQKIETRTRRPNFTKMLKPGHCTVCTGPLN